MWQDHIISKGNTEKKKEEEGRGVGQNLKKRMGEG